MATTKQPSLQLLQMKINGLIKTHSLEDLYYSDYIEIIKLAKLTINDAVDYLATKIISLLDEKDKLSEKTFPKLVFSICLLMDDTVKLNKETIRKVHQAIETYCEYQKQHPELKESIIEQKIDELSEIVYNNYPLEQEESITDSQLLQKLQIELQENIDKITDYEQKLTSLEKELLATSKKLKQQQIANDTFKQNKEKFQSIIANLKETIKELKAKNQRLVQELSQSNQDLESLTFLNLQLTQEKVNLTIKYETLLKEISLLKKEIEQHQALIDHIRQKEKQALEEQKELIISKSKEAQIENIILTTLLTSPNSIEQILTTLKQEGFFLTRDQAFNYLQKLKTRINIVGPSLATFPPTYTLNKNPISTPDKIYLNPILKDSCFDLLIISDLHLTDITRNKLRLNKAYEYATENGIKIILNLGDTFDFRDNSFKYNIDSLDKLERIIEKVIEHMPNAPEIYQLFLGGNHDKTALKLGVDPLAKLAEARSDLINLGYTHKTLILGDKQTINNSIMLHHPDLNFSELLNPNPELSTVSQYLENYYRTNNYSLDDIYLNLFGHTHRSSLNMLDSYCLVPSYLRGRQGPDGAWHLKIYFNDQKDIEYIIFIPLIIDKKLTPVSEIPYQKIRKK